MSMINLRRLTKDEISQNEYPLEDLWILVSNQNDDNQTYGPFLVQELKEYAKNNESLLESFSATNLLKNTFTPFFQNLPFQRREPQLIQASGLVTNQELYLLKNGQKHGPITVEEIKENIENKLLKYSDLISTDKGKSWIKIYEHHLFDRRSREAIGELPFVPDDSIIQKAVSKNQNALNDLKQSKDEEDAIVGLAFLSQGSENAKRAHKTFADATNPSIRIRRKKTTSYNRIMTSLAGVVIIALTYMSLSTDDIKKDNTVQTKTKAINNSPRTIKKTGKRSIASVKKEYKPAVTKKMPSYKPKVKRAEPKRYIRSSVKRVDKKEPRKITHFADEFDKVDSQEEIKAQDNFEREREPAGDDFEREIDYNKDEELTQDQIEAIEEDEIDDRDEMDY